jgi:hypothetical protein
MTARRLFKRVLGLYPADFRARFEPEVLAIAILRVESAVDARARRMCSVREAGGLIAGACREWMAKLTTDPVVRARTLPDCRLMRPVGVTRAEWGAGLARVSPRNGDA